jgi:hypothetical protein
MCAVKPLLIGLSGKAGSGKSTAAEYLEATYDYNRFAFSDTLKAVVGLAFGFSEDQLHGAFKETPDRRFGKSPRWCLQYLGTEILRSVWPEIWIWHLDHSILEFLLNNGLRPIVVTDVRFRNEAEALKRMGAVLVRLERAEAGAQNGISEHVSETDLDGWEGFDCLIVNNGTREQLFEKLAFIISTRH